MHVRAVLPFAMFILWLLSFPMAGFLLPSAAAGELQLWFLVPHTIALATVVTLFGEQRLLRFAPASIAVTMAATAAFPFLPSSGKELMALAGVTAAPFALRATAQLKSAGNATMNGVAGLVAGNVLLYGFMWLPGSTHVKCSLLAFLLLLPLLSRQGWPVQSAPADHFRRYLPFIALFNVVSGLMYGFLLPSYGKVALHNGLELVFYCVAVWGGSRVVVRQRELLLAAGLLCGMLADALIPGHSPGHSPGGINMSMFAMQAAAGCIDLFALSLILSQAQVLRSGGFILATICLGIIGGRIAADHLGSHSGAIIDAGNITLNVAVLSLFLVGRRTRKGDDHKPEQPAEPPPETVPLPDAVSPITEEMLVRCMPGRWLSDKERNVLECIVQGKTFRETARELAISESSVKTYMKRVYEKTGVTGKEALITKLFDGG